VAEAPGLIEARDLTKRFGDKVAVDHLSFDVEPGRVTGFLGPNGAGKSTTMRLITGLDRPDGGPVLVSGQIDRLVVAENEVLVVDFKTNQIPPDTAAEAPAAYIRQLALYRAILARLYPQRTIRTALLWTETPEFMEISAPALDAALASVGDGTAKLDPARARS